MNPCLQFQNKNYEHDSEFIFYQIHNYEVVLCNKIKVDDFTLGTFDGITLPTVTEMLPDTTKVLDNRALLRVQFKTSKRITEGGSVSIIFPSSYTVSGTDTSCYMITLPTKADCYVDSFACTGGNCYRYVLHNFDWTSGALNGGTIFDVYLFVNTPDTAADTDITILSNDETKSMTQRIEETTTTWSYLLARNSPSVAKLHAFMSPEVIARAGDKGKLKFVFTIANDLPEASTPNYGKIEIVMNPGFSQPSETILECYLDDYLSSLCEILVAAPNTIVVYTSRDSDLAAGTAHTLTITTLDIHQLEGSRSTSAAEIGIAYPSVVGDYQFELNTYLVSNEEERANC